MANFGSKIFNNAIGAIAAQQALIANTGNNIANVNTEGFARRVLNLQTRIGSDIAGLSIGNGVEIGSVTRVNDAFLEGLHRSATSDQYQYQTQEDFISRIESVFSLTGENSTLGTALSEFFSSIDNLSLDPASVELRQDMLERANDLVSAISVTYNTLANLQSEADARIENELVTTNGILEEIANMNSLVSAKESNGSVAADERDRRALLLDQLSEKISYNSVESADGSVTITLDNGFPLVNGANYRPIEFSINPSFAGAGGLPPSLSGGVLGSIVYDYDSGAGQAHLDLTQTLAGGGGIIGGLLQMRGYNDPANTSAFDATGGIVDVASRVEAIARDLLVGFNQSYLNYPNDADAGTAGFQSGAIDLDGNSANATNTYAFFGLNYTGTDEDPGKAAAAVGAPLSTDLTYILNNSGGQVHSFASILNVNITDPRDIAAGRVATLPLVPTPEPGDASNLAAISALQTSSRDFGSYNVGSYSQTSTYDQAYNSTVSTVGNLKSRASLDRSVAESNVNLMRARRDEVSGVSLDEEFTNLIRHQKAFEANARMIGIGEELLDTLVQLL